MDTYTRIMDSDGTIIYPSRSVAAKLKVGRNNLLRCLRDKKIFGRDNLPMNMDRRYYRIQRTEHNGVTNLTTYFTDDGVSMISEITHELPKKDYKYKEKQLSEGLLHALEII